MQRPLSLALIAAGLLSAPFATAQTVSPVGRLQVLPAYEMRAPTAAWTGQHYLLVFEAFPESQPELADLYVARITPDGELVGGDVTPLGLGGTTVPQLPDLAVHTSSGAAALTYLEKSGPFSDIALATFDAHTLGGLTAQTLTTGDDAELPPSVGTADAGFLVMWSAVLLSGGTKVFGQRFDPAGAPLDLAPEAIRETSTTMENRPSVLGAGDRWWVAWDEADTTDVDGFLTTISPTGPFRFRAPVRIAQGDGRQSGLTLAPLGPAHYLVWQDFARDVPDAYGARVQEDLQIDQGPHIVTQVDGRTNEPEVAGNQDGALVIWQSLREGRTRGTIRAGRIDTAGRRLEIAGFEVLAAEENVFEPALAKGPDDQYLVAGIEDGLVTRIVFALVNSELTFVEDPPPDAGVIVPDSGNPRRDAGFVDAGVMAPDAGRETPDAGARPPSTRDEGCHAVPGSTLAAWLLLGFGLFGRARRRIRSR